MSRVQKSRTTETNNRRRVLKIGIVALLITLVATFMAMGIFTRLFRGEPTKMVENSSTLGHQEDWAVYMSTIDNDKVGSIMVDLGLNAVAPVKSKAGLLKINITLNQTLSNGLPGAEEHEVLGGVSERLAHELRLNNGAIFAGHLFCQGTLSLYFYVDGSSPYDQTVVRVFSNHQSHRYEAQLEQDPEWRTYRELLYPLPIQLQSIHNQKVVNNLRDSGDKLEVKRPVDHLIYFETEADIDRFLKEVEGKGFEIVSREPTELEGYRWLLLLRRDDPVDNRSVDEYVLFLWQKAQDTNGDYDGWGSTIVRE